MSEFISAMDVQALRKTGVNGSDVYTQPVGESGELLALFGALNRDLDASTLISLMDRAASTSTTEDLFVLAYHTRDILEGKGERALFYHMFLYLYKNNRDSALELLKHVPQYGAWFDFQKILQQGIDDKVVTQRLTDDKVEVTSNDTLVKKVVQLYGDQLTKDQMAEHNLTLAAKWVPRCNKSTGWLAKFIARYLGKNEKEFRQMVSGINKRLCTVEIKMCHDGNGEHHFADIEPAKVPSLCLKKKRKAFFDEEKDGKIRHPDDVDRAKCRENFMAHMEKAVKGDAKVNGKVLMPHEFIVELENRSLTQNDIDTLQAQWNSLRDSIREKGSLGKCVVMSDFSGSMMGGGSSVAPIQVSKGLGLLCAECTSPAFRDRILTFDSTPTWHNISHLTSLRQRVASFQHVSQGTSTNFKGAMDLVLNRLVEAKVPVGEEPAIILVLTDMGWDQANNNNHYYGRQQQNDSAKFETHIDRIKKDFKAKGGWKVPTIVIWNVSGKFQEYHHTSDTEGVCVISGWSAAILKYIMGGEDIVEKMKTMTPYKMMRTVLDDPRYDPIRETLAKVKTV